MFWHKTATVCSWFVCDSLLNTFACISQSFENQSNPHAFNSVIFTLLCENQKRALILSDAVAEITELGEDKLLDSLILINVVPGRHFSHYFSLMWPHQWNLNIGYYNQDWFFFSKSLFIKIFCIRISFRFTFSKSLIIGRDGFRVSQVSRDQKQPSEVFYVKRCS